MSLKRFFIWVCALFLLSGCVQQIYYRDGATVQDIARDRDFCALQALEAAPRKIEHIIVPTPLSPPRRVCDAGGNCRVDHPNPSFPQFETYDANADRRALLTRQCLADRGVHVVKLPICDATVKKSVPVAVTRHLPRLTDRSCIIQRGGGAFQIVSR